MQRLLFITKDTSIEDPGSALYRRVAGMRQMFEEVHIILIEHGVRDEKCVPTERLFDTVWCYRVGAQTFVGSIYCAYEAAISHLVFSGNFRPDVIVADDTHEGGVLGWLLGKKFNRPFQLQISDGFFDEEKITPKPSFIRRAVTDILLSHAQYLAVATEHDREMLTVIYDCPKENIHILPSTFMQGAEGNAATSCDIRGRFPEYASLLMYIPPEKNDEHSFAILHTFSKVLKKYPDLGLLIIQGGPERLHFERKIIALGIQRQVVFEVYSSRVPAYIQSVDMLIHFSDDLEKGRLLAIAGMVRVPVIADVTGKGNELFHDWESAYLCNTNDPACITKAIDVCLNNNDERARITERALTAVQEYFKQDYDKYLEEYTKSITTCSIADSATK